MPAKCVAVNRTGDQAGNPEPAPEAQSSASLSLLPPMNASCDSSDALCGCVVPAEWCLLRSAASAAYYVVPAALCGCVVPARAACCGCVVRTAYCVLRTAYRVVRAATSGLG